MRLLISLVTLALAGNAIAQEDEALIPRPGEASFDLPADVPLADPPDEPVNAERLIDEQEQHMRRLRALQRKAELQAAERDVQKALAETEQARADAEKARNAGKPPAPKVVYEPKGTPVSIVPPPSLVGVTDEAAILDYSGAVHTVAQDQRVNGWLVREVGFDYVVLEGPGGAIRRQELGW